MQANSAVPVQCDLPNTPSTGTQSSKTSMNSTSLASPPLGENTTPASSAYTGARNDSPRTSASKENEPGEDERQSMAGQSRQAQQASGLRNYPRKVAPGAKAMQAAAESRYLSELRQHFCEVPISTPISVTSTNFVGNLTSFSMPKGSSASRVLALVLLGRN